MDSRVERTQRVMLELELPDVTRLEQDKRFYGSLATSAGAQEPYVNFLGEASSHSPSAGMGNDRAFSKTEEVFEKLRETLDVLRGGEGPVSPIPRNGAVVRPLDLDPELASIFKKERLPNPVTPNLPPRQPAKRRGRVAPDLPSLESTEDAESPDHKSRVRAPGGPDRAMGAERIPRKRRPEDHNLRPAQRKPRSDPDGSRPADRSRQLSSPGHATKGAAIGASPSKNPAAGAAASPRRHSPEGDALEDGECAEEPGLIAGTGSAPRDRASEGALGAEPTSRKSRTATDNAASERAARRAWSEGRHEQEGDESPPHPRPRRDGPSRDDRHGHVANEHANGAGRRSEEKRRSRSHGSGKLEGARSGARKSAEEAKSAEPRADLPSRRQDTSRPRRTHEPTTGEQRHREGGGSDARKDAERGATRDSRSSTSKTSAGDTVASSHLDDRSGTPKDHAQPERSSPDNERASSQNSAAGSAKPRAKPAVAEGRRRGHAPGETRRDDKPGPNEPARDAAKDAPARDSGAADSVRASASKSRDGEPRKKTTDKDEEPPAKHGSSSRKKSTTNVRRFRILKNHMEAELQKTKPEHYPSLAREAVKVCFQSGLDVENDWKKQSKGNRKRLKEGTEEFYRYITNKMVNDIRTELSKHGLGSEDEEQYYKVVLAKTIMRQLALDVAFNTRKRDQLKAMGDPSNIANSSNISFNSEEASQLKDILEDFKLAMANLEVVMEREQEAGGECNVS